MQVGCPELLARDWEGLEGYEPLFDLWWDIRLGKTTAEVVETWDAREGSGHSQSFQMISVPAAGNPP